MAMSTLVRFTMKDGTVLNGISYRMDPGSPGASMISPTFSFEGRNGWITVRVADVVSIETKAGRPT